MRPEVTLPALLSRLWEHLGRRRQRQFILLMGLMLISAIAEVISLGAVLPFIGILAAPELVFKHPLIANLARGWGIVAPAQLVLPLTIAFVVAAVVAASLRILLLWLTTRLTFAAGADLSIEVYRRTLYQPYYVHVGRGSSEVISGITSKVGGTVFGILLPGLTLISSMILLLALIVALLFINWTVALVAVAGFGGGYALITNLARRRLRRNSQRIAREYTQVVKALQEGLGGIRDVLLDGTQPVYCEIYRTRTRRCDERSATNVFIGQSPRFAMEALAMVFIAALAYGLSQQPGGLATALPVLAALALGAQRPLPALQQAYGAWASIIGSRGSLADTIELLDQAMPADCATRTPAAAIPRNACPPAAVCASICGGLLGCLTVWTSMIPKGARIGIVGGTGSGESTALDLLMGC